MTNFNIRQDLAARPAAQSLEILAISGPTAPWVMKALVDKDYDRVQKRFGIVVDPTAAATIVDQFQTAIHTSYEQGAAQ